MADISVTAKSGEVITRARRWLNTRLECPRCSKHFTIVTADQPWCPNCQRRHMRPDWKTDVHEADVDDYKSWRCGNCDYRISLLHSVSSADCPSCGAKVLGKYISRPWSAGTLLVLFFVALFLLARYSK